MRLYKVNLGGKTREGMWGLLTPLSGVWNSEGRVSSSEGWFGVHRKEYSLLKGDVGGTAGRHGAGPANEALRGTE